VDMHLTLGNTLEGVRQGIAGWLGRRGWTTPPAPLAQFVAKFGPDPEGCRGTDIARRDL
jgi:hypothetical protein